jgi:5-methylcytosine-specific restriction endonuclease McrA
MAKARNYSREYQAFQASPQQKKDRAARNKARAEAMKEGKVSKGDDREINHKVPLARGGSNAKSNQEVVSRTENRKQGKKLKSEAKKTPKKK